MYNKFERKRDIGNLVRYIERSNRLDYLESVNIINGREFIEISVFDNDVCVMDIMYHELGIEVSHNVHCALYEVETTDDVIEQFLKEWA